MISQNNNFLSKNNKRDNIAMIVNSMYKHDIINRYAAKIEPCLVVHSCLCFIADVYKI